MPQNDRTASSRQLAASWSTVTGVLMSASSIRRRPLHRGLNGNDPISYKLSTVLNNNRYFQEERQPEIIPFLQGVSGVIFQQVNTRPHVAKSVRDFCSAQHMQRLSWPAYLPDTSPIEYVLDLEGQRFTRDPRPAASKDERLLHIQAIWNSLPQADTQNLFNFMPRRIAALFAALGGYTKY
ncbi:hypothetical protein TNCV_136311 [Trichonephila clavipes]|nr:hypothetical protein TNCV_136311 [Trichonephila clavipes]